MEQRPAAVEQKAAAKQLESVAPEDSKPVNKPVEALQRRVEHEPHQRAMRSDGCKSYRTTIQYPEPTGASMDSAGSADRFGCWLPSFATTGPMRTRSFGPCGTLGCAAASGPGLSNVLTPHREKENQLSAFVKGSAVASCQSRTS
jgi:hypothetical protein